MKGPIFAVIAAKNEEENISEVIRATRRFVDCVVAVDDGSTDKTKEISTAAGAIALTHIVNLGKGAAIKTGCEYAISKGAKIIVLLDADGQHEPKEIPKFLKKLQENDIVFGVRTKKRSMPLILKFGNWFINKVTFILYHIDIADTQCGYRAFKADIYNKIRWNSSDYSMESEMIANVGRMGLKYAEIDISTIYSDKYKGTTIMDGIKICFDMIRWKIIRW